MFILQLGKRKSLEWNMMHIYFKVNYIGKEYISEFLPDFILSQILPEFDGGH